MAGRIKLIHLIGIVTIALIITLITLQDASPKEQGDTQSIGTYCDPRKPVATGMVCRGNTLFPAPPSGDARWGDFHGVSAEESDTIKRTEKAKGARCYYLSELTTLVCHYDRAAAKRADKAAQVAK